MTAVVVEDVTVQVARARLLDRLSLSVRAGDVVALLGPNGAGKTTLLRCILGVVRPTSGSVLLDGHDSQRTNGRVRAGLVAHLAQHATSDDTITAKEYVAAARFRFDESRATSERAAVSALVRVGGGELVERRLGGLSGGERQRVAFAALLAQEATTLLLDEPANHLDPARQAQSYALLGELQQLGHTLIIVTHDVNLIAYLARPERVRVVGLERGRLAFELPYGSNELAQALSKLYDVPMRTLYDGEHQFIVPARSA